MKKLLLMMLSALMICGMFGCSSKSDEPTNTGQDSSQTSEETAPLIWAQVESEVVKLETSLTELAEQNEEGLVLATDEEVKDLVKRVEDIYETVKDGFTTAHKETVLELYDAARRLELSGSEHVMSLGTAVKDFMLGMLGHTVVEDVAALQENVTSALAYVHSVYENDAEETLVEEQSKGAK